MHEDYLRSVSISCSKKHLLSIKNDQTVLHGAHCEEAADLVRTVVHDDVPPAGPERRVYTSTVAS